jgi:predicted nucleotidyltransferase
MKAMEASRDRILSVANALPGSVLSKAVFMGGSVLPLLMTDEDTITHPRPTKDVDAVMATSQYTEFATIEEQLRAAGFTSKAGVANTGGTGPPICRWTTPGGDIFDLTMAGDHVGGTGSKLDLHAIDTAIRMEGAEHVRHVSAAGFLLLKTRAYMDRGARTENRDLHDIAVLIACRETLLNEIASVPQDVRDAIVGEVGQLLKSAHLTERIRRGFKDRIPVAPHTVASLENKVTDVLRQIASA